MLLDDFEIRLMREEDLQAVMEIEKVCYPEPWSIETFKQGFVRDEYEAIVGELEKKIIGYAVFWQGVGEVHILNIAVDPKLQNLGFGTKLLNYILNFYSKEKYPKFILEVRTNNISAISLYESKGFQRIGIRKGYYSNGDDALVMELCR